MQTNIGLFLAKRAQLDPQRVGLVFEGRKLTFRAWNASANRAANAFAGLGIRHGERVGLLMGNSLEFLECFFGLAKIGAIVVPLNWRLTAPELAYIAGDAGIVALVYGAEYAQTAAALRGRIAAAIWVAVGAAPLDAHSYAALTAAASDTEPEPAGAGGDPLVIMFTSGTTGKPKGAVLSHDNLFYDSCTVALSTDWRWGDRVLVALPLFHIGALIDVVIDVHVGSTTILMKAFDPAGFLRTLQDEKVDSFLAVPAMLHFMLQVPTIRQFDLSSVRWALCGTAPVPVPLIHAWAELGIAIQQVYGLTECSGGAAVLNSERALDKVGSTGLPMFHTDIRVVDERGADAAPGEIGEIIIRGPHVMREYWNNPQATAETVREGWLYTGDVGRRDAEGYLYIVERKKDMLISGGENIYPAEVESVLTSLPQCAEVAVIGMPDPDWGEAVCAVVRLKAGQLLTLDEVVAHCAGKLGKYKIPKKLVVVDEPLPRNPTGKLLKRLLRERYAAAGPA
ncbi:MAG: long-chain fatty acid--CoA ligase [Rubrivivax sp.]|nr:long-chain fatty acid--CoA ligase [Rubrivivax sp.]MCL4698533.1 long-chain fatty acid--CoA ligase [Burkholderiaceae bacterium]